MSEMRANPRVIKLFEFDDSIAVSENKISKSMNITPQFKSRFPHKLLNEIKWKGYDLSKCKIYYLNRGSPDDTAVVEGSQIKEIGKGFLILEGTPYETYIPYHRIINIEYDGQIIFEKSGNGQHKRYI